MNSDAYASFRAKLNREYNWPADYLFKFIAPATQQNELAALFPGKKLFIRQSGKGKYISITVTLHMDSADKVIALYREAARIPGIIML